MDTFFFVSSPRACICFAEQPIRDQHAQSGKKQRMRGRQVPTSAHGAGHAATTTATDADKPLALKTNELESFSNWQQKLNSVGKR